MFVRHLLLASAAVASIAAATLVTTSAEAGGFNQIYRGTYSHVPSHVPWHPPHFNQIYRGYAPARHHK